MEQVLIEQPDLILIATGAVESCDASCDARFTFIGVDGDSNERPIILEWMSPHCATVRILKRIRTVAQPGQRLTGRTFAPLRCRVCFLFRFSA
jgi:hypothetical protein